MRSKPNPIHEHENDLPEKHTTNWQDCAAAAVRARKTESANGGWGAGGGVGGVVEFTAGDAEYRDGLF